MSGFREHLFSENMKRRRDLLGMNQTELARRMKAAGYPFHQQTVQRVEAGERPIRLDEAYAVAEILGSSVDSMTRAYQSGFADVIHAVETLRRESANAYDGVMEITADWQEAFSEVYAEFARSVPLAGDLIDERGALIAAWVLKSLWVHETINELLVFLNGLFADNPNEDWHEPVLTRDVPGVLDQLQDETSEPWASLPERLRPVILADLNPRELLERLRTLGSDGEHQAEA